MAKWRFFLTSGLVVLALFFIGRMPAQALPEQPNTNQSSVQTSLSPDAVRERNKQAIQELNGQAKTDIEYSLDGRTNIFTLISGKGNALPLSHTPPASDAEAVAGQFMKEYGRYLGLHNADQELLLIKKGSDALGMRHVRYNQLYDDILVFGAQTIVHLKNDLSVTSVNGRTIPTPSLNTTPLITKVMAAQKAENLWRQQGRPMSPTILAANQYIFNKNLVEKSSDTTNYLVWRVELFKKFPQAHEYYFIDAHDGRLIKQITGIQSAISRRIYDCSPGDGYCYLDTLGSGYYYGRSEGQPVRGANPLWGGTDVDDLYALSGSVHNYYSGTFGLDGANNQGGLGDGSHNAVTRTDGYTYIDYAGGSCPNAYYDGYSINFCQGLEVTDVVAHEYGHAVTAWTADLIYSYESGALNESYSDIFGSAVENYAGDDDWLVGEDVNVPGMTGPLRSMSDPPSVGAYPDRFYSSNYYCGSSDEGGVHTNSSVPNHAAYLMAVGGTFNGCTVSGIGRAKEEAIWYRALTTYLTTSSGFNAAYTALNLACNDLYGAGSAECSTVITALQAVEMDQLGACSSVPRVEPGCSNPTITNVTSDTVNSYYTVNSAIDIDLAFSSAVSGSGTVTLDTGGSCSFTVTSAATATCTYTVAAGENSQDLTVSSVSGAITNQSGYAMTNFTPVINLGANKAIIIDTTAPTGTISISDGAAYTTDFAVWLSLYASDTNGVPSMRFSNDGATYTDWEAGGWTKLWSVDTTQGAKTVYAQYTDLAGNIGTASDDIIYDSVVPTTTISPSAGRVKKDSAVTLTASETATIYYTADGSTPSTSSAVYASPITISADTTINYFAADPAGNTETMKTASYLLVRAQYILAISNQGGDSLIKAFNYKGTARATPKNLYAFNKTYKGGGHVAACDVDGDWKDELVVGVGSAEEPWVKVMEVNGTVITQFLAYAKNIKGGVFVACGDLDGDNKAEVVTGVPEGYGPHVRVFNGQTGKVKITNGFFAYGKNVRTGIRVATGDLDADGKDEIIVGAGTGAGPHVRTFSGSGVVKFTPGFFVYEKTDRTGIKVAAGDVNGDGVDEIITGSGKGRVGEVQILARDGKVLKKLTPYGNTFKNGVKVSTADLDGDGVYEIITGTEVGSGPQIKSYRLNGSAMGAFFGFDKNTRFGVEVVGASLD